MKAVSIASMILSLLVIPPANAQDDDAYIPRSIELQGVTVLPAAEVAAVLERFEGVPLGFGELQRLRVELSTLYSDAGYVNSGVVIPDQDVGDVLRLEAVEGQLSRVELVGSTRLRSAYVSKRFAERNAGVLNVESLQATLRWLQKDPNIERIDAELIPGLEAGEGVLRLAIDDPKKYTVSLFADNYRSAALGAEAVTVAIEAQNLTGFGEHTYFSAGTSKGSDAFSLRIGAPIDSRNSRIDLYYTRSDAQIIEDRFEQLDIKSQVDAFGVSLWRPVFESPVQNLAVTLVAEKKISTSSLLGVPFSFSPGAQNGKSATTTLEAGLEWALRKPSSATALRLSYRRGFHVLDATEQLDLQGPAAALNPTGADGKFGRYRLQGSYLRLLKSASGEFGDGSRLVVKANAQFATDPLLSLEKLSVGGRHTVRGFRENSFVRDSGVMLTTELQWPLFGPTDVAQWKNLSVVPFLDYGWSWDKKNVNPGSEDTTKNGRIGSAGIGLRWQPFDGVRTEFYWGESIGDNRRSNQRQGVDYDLQDDGLHFSLSYSRVF